MISRVLRVSQVISYKTFNVKNLKTRTFTARIVPFVSEFVFMHDYSLESVEHMAREVAVGESATLLFQIATVLYNLSAFKSDDSNDT